MTDLEAAVVKAALNLFDDANSAAFIIPIPNTSPPLFVAAGEAAAIVALVGTK